MTNNQQTTIKTKYVIQDREAGNKIDEFESLELAQQALSEFEAQDINDGIFVPNFYEIVEA